MENIFNVELTQEQERILYLRKEILRLDELDDLGQQEITDTEYDILYDELVKLEEKHPEMYDEESPTQKITTDLIEGLKKVEHTVPMLSQEKAKTEEKLRAFCKRADMSDGIVVSWKLDGLTIVTQIVDSKPKAFITRGNGKIGEVVTPNLKSCFIKKVKSQEPVTLEIRSEAVIPIEKFEEINVNGEFKSPRNLASGSVRTLDTKVAKERGVKLIAFDTINVQGKDFTLDTERFSYLNELGIETVPYEVFYDEESLIKYCLSFNEKIRPTLPIKIDGLVLTYNNLAIREELGWTSKYPKWGIAYKFESQDAKTTLKDVVWQVSKTGILAPVGVFEEVHIDGSDITRASLANIDNIRKRDIKLGDKILVAKANDVIPQIVSSFKEERTGNEKEIEIPTTCPICGSKTIFDETFVTCPNLDCEGRILGTIQHFVSKNAMNIGDLGDSTVKTLYQKGYIESIQDIYKLQEKHNILSQYEELEQQYQKLRKNNKDKGILEETTETKTIRQTQDDMLLKFPYILNLKPLDTLEGFGTKKISKIFDNIEKSKSNDLSKVLYALCIPNFGEVTSKTLAIHFGNMDNLLSSFETKTTEELTNELLELKDFGDVIVSSLLNYISNKKEYIKELQTLGLSMIEPIKKVIQNDSVSGKTFVVTGDVFHFKNRKELQIKIEEMGGKVVGSVSKKTDYLINNDVNSTSGKNKKAKELNIPIISEDDFLAML